MKRTSVKIPRHVARVAQALLRAQRSIPASPGVIEDGKISYCVGAACAAAALEIVRGAREREEFDRRLLCAGSSAIVEAFVSAGLDGSLARTAIAINDATKGSKRIGILRRLVLL